MSEAVAEADAEVEVAVGEAWRPAGWVVGGILFAEGFCSLAAEMIGLRLLAPVAGQSIAVTSVVVSVFLAALALGYRRGGEHGDGQVRGRVARFFAYSAGWAGVWLSTVGVMVAFVALERVSALLAVAVYAVVGVAPIAYWMAATVVSLVSVREESGAPGKAGGAFSASTIGNVAGGMVTTLVLMHWFGVAASAFVVVAALAAVAVALAPRGGRTRWPWLWVAAVGVSVAAAHATVERKAFIRSTEYADYQVREDIEGSEGGRVLLAGVQQASMDYEGGIGLDYVEWIEDRVWGMERPSGCDLRVLVIGAGGMTLGRGRAAQGVEVTFVDVDGALPQVAEVFLGERPSGGFVQGDGRAFLLEGGGTWDVIVLDAFRQRISMPIHLVTKEALGLMRERLAEGGRFYLNLISRVSPGEFEIRADRTLRSVFSWCSSEALGWGEANPRYQRIYECEKHRLDGERVVFTDGDTRGEVDGAALGLWRRSE